MPQYAGTGWFCTWPKCPMSPDDVLPRLLQHLPPVKWCVIAQEHHADGELHIHAAIMLEKRFQPRVWDVFDDVTGQHGNYQVMKSPKGSIEYCNKEGSPLEYGKIPTFGKGAKGKTDQIAIMLMDGASIEEVNEKYPGFTMQNKRKIEDYHAWQASLSLKRVRIAFPGVQYYGEDSQTQSVCDWLSRNLTGDREFKSPQLWLYGPPDSRKTSLCRKLETYFHIYWTPNSELFYDGFEDSHDLIVMDEFREGKPSEWLNLWLEGSTMMVRRKGLSPVVKRRNPSMIICSNFLPQQLYGEPVALASLLARIVVVRLENPIDMDNIKFESAQVEQHIEISSQEL